MSSSIFVPGMCVNHPAIKAIVGFRCAECAHNAGILVSAKPVQIASGKTCVNHRAVSVVEGSHFCAECKAFADKRKAEIETARTEAAKKDAVERTGNPLATGRRGRIADPLKKAKREAESADRAAKRMEREAKKAREAEKTAKLPFAFHSWIPSKYPEFPGDDPEKFAKWQADCKIWEKDPVYAASLCGICGMPKRNLLSKHGDVKRIDPFLPETTDHSEMVPVLVLMRASDPSQILTAVAKLARSFLRSGKIHFLPRSKRNHKDLARAGRPDLLIGPLAADLDSEPFALWIPLDPNGGNKSDLGWIREVIEHKQMIAEKYVVVTEIPAEVPDRCNPSSWNEIADMTGAEVIDLRNYSDVLAEVRDSIAEDLDRSTEWSDILRENAETRNGVCFARTAKDGSAEYFDAKLADPENEKREDPPAQIASVVKEVADDFRNMPCQSILNGRRFVLEFDSEVQDG